MKSVPFWLLVALFVALLCGGCATGSRRQPPPAAASVSAGPAGPVVAQDGAAAVPATAARKETRVETTIPAGAAVTAYPDGRVTWTAAAPMALVSASSDSSATGPQSFTPPAPPTPAEEARGWGVRAFYLAALACAIAAGLCVWRGYPLAAICCGAGALALPILANFFGSMSATVAGVACVAIAAGLVVAYQLTARRAASAPGPPPAPLPG